MLTLRAESSPASSPDAGASHAGLGGACHVTPAGLSDQLTPPNPWSSPLASSAEVKALWEAKLPASRGHFKITCRSPLKTSLSWQIKET